MIGYTSTINLVRSMPYGPNEEATVGTKPFLAMPDVIRLWKEETGRTITRATVVKHLQRSKPADPATGRPAGRHITDPFPVPGEGRDLWWPLDQEAELRDWIRRHSTPGRRKANR